MNTLMVTNINICNFVQLFLTFALKKIFQKDCFVYRTGGNKVLYDGYVLVTLTNDSHIV